MNYKIIADSCCDLAEGSKLEGLVKKIPLILTVGGNEIIDDDNLDQLKLIKAIADSADCPKSACPSPQAYLDAYEQTEENEIYVITLSSKLSGSYESACIAAKMYIEDNGETKKIHVIDSLTASVGEANIAEKIALYNEDGLTFEEVVKKAEEFRDNQETLFVLDNIDTMRKNGRMTSIQALVASVLNIKPVLAGDNGTITKLDQTRGIDRALTKMLDIVVQRAKNPESLELAISHCNCLQRAIYLKDEISKRISFKNITITGMSGISTLYANDGGVIMCF